MTSKRNNNGSSGKGSSFMGKVKKYFEDNEFYFLSYSCLMNGNSYMLLRCAGKEYGRA